LDGRFFREEERVGLWEWRYPFGRVGDPLVVLDLETTGLSPHDNEITEIALMRVEGSEVVKLSRLVNPGTPIPEFITQLTGISDADVADAPDVYTVLEEVAPYLEGATLIIQNAPFDLGFLRPRMSRVGVKIHNEVIDTVQWARRSLPRMKRRGLDYLIKAFAVSIDPKDRHRALGDVEATWRVAREMYYILTAGEPRRPAEV
jgi:DNA polymerase-3 subunit epsilon